MKVKAGYTVRFGCQTCHGTLLNFVAYLNHSQELVSKANTSSEIVRLSEQYFVRKIYPAWKKQNNGMERGEGGTRGEEMGSGDEKLGRGQKFAGAAHSLKFW